MSCLCHAIVRLHSSGSRYRVSHHARIATAAAVARDQLQYASKELTTHNSAQVQQIFGKNIQAALTGDKTPEQALQDAQTEAEKLLAQFNLWVITPKPTVWWRRVPAKLAHVVAYMLTPQLSDYFFTPLLAGTNVMSRSPGYSPAINCGATRQRGSSCREEGWSSDADHEEVTNTRIRLCTGLFVYSRPLRGRRGMALFEKYWS